MSYYAVPYRVLFDDTMAYGSHHYLTNFKFQCLAREALLFSKEDGVHNQQQLKDDFDNILLLTQEGYSRNLAPVKVGQTVTIFMTYEDLGRSSVRLCFRVVRDDGQPVSCSYQTIVCVSLDNKLLAFPTLFKKHFLRNQLLDPLAHSFAEYAHKGAIKKIFKTEICDLGKQIANLCNNRFYPRFVNANKLPDFQAIPTIKNGTVFIFPGKDSYDPILLYQLTLKNKKYKHYVDTANKLTQEHFSFSFWSLLQAKTKEEHDKLLQHCPDVKHVGMYLLAVIAAKNLQENSVDPQLLIGHSFGEIAALTVAGVIDVETGLKIVCLRFKILQTLPRLDVRMVAVSCDLKILEMEWLQLFDEPLEIAGVNHNSQTIILVKNNDLITLQTGLATKKIMATELPISYPFHSQELKPAMAIFEEKLKSFVFSEPDVAILSPITGELYSSISNYSYILASHLVQPFDFKEAINLSYNNGYRKFIECGVGNTVTKLIHKNLKDDNCYIINMWQKNDYETNYANILKYFGKLSEIETTITPYKDLPVAVIAMGCVVPGAHNVDAFWKNLQHGVSGIVDVRFVDPFATSDFLIPNEVNPDKTYSLLTGLVPNLNDVSIPLSYTKEEFSLLSQSEKFLAYALNECNLQIDDELGLHDNNKIACFIGATADGSKEHDEALLLENLHKLDEQNPKWLELLEKVFHHKKGNDKKLSSSLGYRKIVQKMLRSDVETYLIDAACASSLYTIDLGVKNLQNFQSDLTIVGGVFSPGPANSCLFSQFKGLSAQQSRPFDVDADGVIFGEGAAVLVLKRLPDAIRDGNKIIAVVRGAGLSSDGKSPSVNVPRSSGQLLALENAYRKTNVDPDTIQYIEAHATSTKVGDATEFNALKEFFKNGKKNEISLASVKSLIGHTGWLSGCASTIKICKSFQEQLILPQFNYKPTSGKNVHIDLTNSPFEISEKQKAWPKNKNNVPRRAGISGFGFGGTNAHLLIEEYQEEYHKQYESKNYPAFKHTSRLAIVSVQSVFPDAKGLPHDFFEENNSYFFDKSKMPFPKNKLILPDVADHMDGMQILALLLAEKIIAEFPDISNFHKSTGVVLGIDGKAEDSVFVLQRLYSDRIKRYLEQEKYDENFCSKVTEYIKNEHIVTGPYTLPGIMPNVATGRIAQMNDFQGANMVINAGSESLWEAFKIAAKLIDFSDCDVVLAGGISYLDKKSMKLSNSKKIKNSAAGIMLAFMHPEKAKKFNIIGYLDIDNDLEIDNAEAIPVSQSKRCFRGAQGALEVLFAVDSLKTNNKRYCWKHKQDTFTFYNVSSKKSIKREKKAIFTDRSLKKVQKMEKKANNTMAPIHFYTPALFASINTPKISLELKNKKILFVTDQPRWFQKMEQSDVLSHLQYDVLCPDSYSDTSYHKISLEDGHVTKKLKRSLTEGKYNIIIAIKNVTYHSFNKINQELPWPLLDMLFFCSQMAYQEIKKNNVIVATLSLNMWKKEKIHPFSGLLGGFIKSFAREVPNATCKAIHCDTKKIMLALEQLEKELCFDNKQQVEIFYCKNERQVEKLVQTTQITQNKTSILNKNSVVLATGGGRGVTSVLMEELLSKYGCTVIATGRTDISSVPQEYLQMSYSEFCDWEAEFYEKQLDENPNLKMKELKQRYNSYQAANELHNNLKMLKKLPGKIDYYCCDITNFTAVDEMIKSIVIKYSSIDLVIHGAGIQISQQLNKKKIFDFRRIIATKLNSIQHIQKSCLSHIPQQVNFHLLTSSFSYMGNDGQPDYGAANEALNRLATYMTTNWSTLGWLGWVNTGMTQNSEYEMVARTRNLRPVTRKEGKALFSRILSGQPLNAVNILLTKQEKSYYQIETIDNEQNMTSDFSETLVFKKKWPLNTKNNSYLLDHLVRNVPTLPGSFALEITARTAKEFYQNYNIIQFEDVYFRKFIKIFPNKTKDLNCIIKTINKEGNNIRVLARIVCDFIHDSGIILQKEMVMFEAIMILSKEDIIFPDSRQQKIDNWINLFDPYVQKNSSVKLQGMLKCLHSLEVGEKNRRGIFELNTNKITEELDQFSIPAILLDALWRFSMIHEDNKQLPISVPEMGGKMIVASLTDREVSKLRLVGSNPIIKGESVYNDWVQAITPEGKVIAMAENLVARRILA